MCLCVCVFGRGGGWGCYFEFFKNFDKVASILSFFSLNLVFYYRISKLSHENLKVTICNGIMCVPPYYTIFGKRIT